MLTGSLSENNKDVNILGDALDLNALHHTVRKIMLVILDYLPVDNDASNILVSFLERIEQAYLGRALHKQLHACQRQLNYQGFITNHTELTAVNHLLHTLSAYTVLDEADEVNLLHLEKIIKQTDTSGKDMNHINGSDLHLDIKAFIEGFSCKTTNPGPGNIFLNL
ncbi:hypothetical protein [Pedobacter frigoris]|uniref:hypothetical protein n=1 Tax=Pedobacter frigoris TaxID=2571272 RepID=UPI0029319A43|nr:hypothetical protein [Pedobacter frigoris]